MPRFVADPLALLVLISAFTVSATPAQAVHSRIFKAEYAAYLNTVNFSASIHGLDVEVADLDGDGKLELVELEAESPGFIHKLAVLEADGVALSPLPRFVTLGFGSAAGGSLKCSDIDQDGVVDVLALAGDSLRVLRGLGGGAFDSPVRYYTPSVQNGDLTVADLDGDGDRDVVVVRMAAGRVNIFWGVGGGALVAGPEFVSLTDSYVPSAGDLDGDGDLDVVVSSRVGTGLLLNTGGRTFAQSALATIYGTIAGDLDDDGHLDLAGSGEVRYGLGDGTFGGPVPTGVTMPIGGRDLDDDGRLDLIGYGASNSANFICTQTNRGARVFSVPRQFLSYGDAFQGEFGDLDGDGHLDMARVNYTGYQAIVLHGDGSGGFEQGLRFPAGLSPAALAIGRLNADATPDIAIAGNSGRVISVLRSTGPAAYADADVYPVPFVHRMIGCADLNADGREDVVAASDSSSDISIWLAQPDGTLGARSAWAAPGLVQGFTLQDVDNNGSAKELILSWVAPSPGASSGTILARGDGAGTFLAAQALTSLVTAPFAIADVSGDGILDLVGQDGFGKPSVCLASAPGVFGPATRLATASQVIGIAVARLDPDAIPDLVVRGTFGTLLYPGLGGGAFGPPQTLANIGGSFRAVADLDSDGYDDLLTSSFSSSMVFRGSASGAFSPEAGGGHGFNAVAFAVADFDGNGRLDVAAACQLSFAAIGDQNRISIALNQTVTPNVGVPPSATARTDLMLTASPNPARGALHLRFAPSASESTLLEIVDVAGRTVLEHRILMGKEEWSLGGSERLAPGLYFARIRQGAHVAVTRFVTLR